MNLQDFKKTIQKRYRFEKYSDYFSPTILLVMGVVAVIYFHTTIAVVVSSVVIIMSISAIVIFIPKNYRITTIVSSLPLNAKEEIAVKVLEALSSRPPQSEHGYYTACLPSQHASFSLVSIQPRNIHLAFDENGFYFFMETPSSGRGGLVEMSGMTQKYNSKIVDSIRSEIASIAQ